MHTPKVSILLPVYNGGRYLESALQSVLNQTEPDFELLIADDGSTDNSPAIIERFKDPRIRFQRNSGNLGLFRNLNQLLLSARGEIVRFFCQDDVLAPDCLAFETEYFQTHPEVKLLMVNFSHIDETGRTLSTKNENNLPEFLTPQLAVQQFFYHGCIPGNLSVVSLRQSVIKEFGGFRPDYRISGDYEYWARVARRHGLGVTKKTALAVRIHSDRLSSNQKSAIPYVRESLDIAEKLIPDLPPEIQRYARLFRYRRQCAIAFHVGVRFFLKGHFKNAWTLYSGLGVKRVILGGFFWAVTLNNRLHPLGKWVLPSESDQPTAEMPRLKRGA